MAPGARPPISSQVTDDHEGRRERSFVGIRTVSTFEKREGEEGGGKGRVESFSKVSNLEGGGQ